MRREHPRYRPLPAPVPRAPSSPEKFKGKPPAWAAVTASVYELHNLGAIRRVVGRLDHVGIVVYGVEWSYGANNGGTGVFPSRPGECPLGAISHSLSLGVTRITPTGVVKMLTDMQPLWPGPDYSLLEKNCQHFSMELIDKLGCKALPDWVTESLKRYGKLEANKTEPIEMVYKDYDTDELHELVEAEQDYTEKCIIQVEIVFRVATSHMNRCAEATARSARFEDCSVEIVHPGDRNVARALDDLSRRADFRQAIHGAFATALNFADSEQEDADWVEIRDLTRVAADCLVANIRLHSAPESPDEWPPKMPQLEEFERLFLRSLYSSVREGGRKLWPSSTLNILGSLQIRTAPGMTRFGERIELQGGGGASVLFPSDAKPTPSDTLSRLRSAVLRAGRPVDTRKSRALRDIMSGMSAHYRR
eukprot:TRINITY_DN69032_c0_g1_i1.p1 TRINITY_DN69032_c0_g1~~TRINITY_DN69032_c0_g1_i1.p1  ORF type:complete len:420 (+),score=41.79 TRINITY_DN69032_c0_g1_i1:120-1379(+)